MPLELEIGQTNVQINGAGNRRPGSNLLVGLDSGGSYQLPGLLRNRYVIVRHGKSVANEQEKIISAPATGIGNYGLTEQGLNQAQIVAESLQRYKDIKLYTSPFLRCVQTAEVIARGVGTQEVIWSPELRERYFGRFEGGHKRFYRDVYHLDRVVPGNNFNGVESTHEVAQRAVALVNDLERKWRDKTLVLVTHADVGEILQTAFLGLPPHEHRNLPKLKNAEARELRLLAFHQ